MTTVDLYNRSYLNFKTPKYSDQRKKLEEQKRVLNLSKQHSEIIQNIDLKPNSATNKKYKLIPIESFKKS